MENVRLEVSQEIVRPIVEAKINEVLIQSFEQHKTSIIAEIVAQTLRQKVNDEGVVDENSYHNKTEYFTWVVNGCIKKVAKETFEKWVEIQKPEIEKAMMAILKKEKDAVIKNLLKKMVLSIDNDRTGLFGVIFGSEKK